jgi:DNA sulfur modification protein DndC
MKRQLSLFGQTYTMWDSVDTTVASLNAYGRDHDHWAIAFSGGKDSTTAATVTAYAIAQGLVPAPKTLLLLMSNTRMELPPLFIQAQHILAQMRQRGIQTRIVEPPMAKRFYNYMLGRGVPPPKNRFRWCTASLKVDPMMHVVRDLAAQYGQKFLVITGVRRGESDQRDQRIETVCSQDDGECGLGMWLGPTDTAPYATLAPLLHWRTCHIWDWLTFEEHRHGFTTRPIATIYGQEEQRTGCIACPLCSHDKVLASIVTRLPEWAYLSPLLELRYLWAEMRKPQHRKRKRGERVKDGSFSKHPMRLGPLTMEARAHFLDLILDIQERARYELITAQDLAFIRQCWADNTWPNGWDGTEEIGNVLMEQIHHDGATQQIFSALAGVEY